MLRFYGERKHANTNFFTLFLYFDGRLSLAGMIAKKFSVLCTAVVAVRLWLLKFPKYSPQLKKVNLLEKAIYVRELC